MARIPYTVAASRLGMTVVLLRWFESYSPKRDGVKLKVHSDGTIDEQALQDFEAYLREPWPDRRVPSGIERELRKEAAGVCPLCGASLEVMDVAHIRRKGYEVEYYCQHPHNLICLCVACHGRYDRSKGVDVDTVEHHKQRVLARLMEQVKHDVGRAAAIDRVVGELQAEGLRRISQAVADVQARAHEEITSRLWEEFAPRIAGALVGLGAIRPEFAEQVRSAGDLRGVLISASADVAWNLPTTSGTLAGYSLLVGRDPTVLADHGWAHVPLEDRTSCRSCDSLLPLRSATCARCREDVPVEHDDQYEAEHLPDGTKRITLHDGGDPYLVARMKEGPATHSLACPRCGCERLFLEFDDDLCGSCRASYERA